MKKHVNISLGALVLGVLTSGLVACGDEEARKESAEQQTASITAKGIGVAGCGANGVFNLSAPSSSSSQLDFVAIDQSDFANLTSQLSSFNAQEQQSIVSNQATQLDSSLQTIINEATNSTSAFQLSQQASRQAVHSDRRTSITENARHSDSTIVTNDSQSEQWSSNSGSASNEASSYNNNSAANIAKQSSNLSNSLFNTAQSFSGGGGKKLGLGFGGIGGGIGAITDVSTTNSAFNDANTFSLTANFANSSDAVSSRNRTEFANYNAARNSQHSAIASANEWSRSLKSDTNDSMDSVTEQSSIQKAAQAASSASANASKVASERSSYVAFKNLSELQSKNFVLNVNMTAADNQTHTLRVFQGNNQNISAMQNFAINFPGCGAAKKL